MRVISIAPNATEIIFALGASDRLVGVSDFCRLPKGQNELPRVGGLIDPNLERILLLKPNLIIARGKMREVEKLCEANQIALYHDPTESYDDIFRTIRELGDLLSRHEQAAALTQQITERVDRVTERIAGKTRPRVLFTTDRPLDSLARVTTCGRNTFVDEIIRRAGGENVFGRVDVAYPEVSLESILVARPEVIIEVMPSSKREITELTESVRTQ
ncbi:MAG TPA: helical backbone metal receptor, partial [Phycisphaerae bacterium]|nr:helical backbone metal receptor [Phycisphaerae bacterium]